MNYLQIYNRLIISRKLELLITFGHIHHIIPKYMKGSNLNINLVKLSIREHILAHYLLWKIYKNLEDYIAFTCLSGKTDNLEKLRIELSIKNSKLINSIRFKENNPMKNKIIVKKALESKKLKYGKNGLSDKHLKSIKDLLHLTINSEKAKQKSKENRKVMYENMTDKEKKIKYGKSGKNAGNYGKRRGKYKVIDPLNNITFFESQELIMTTLKISQSTLFRHRNKGIINSKSRVKENNKWNKWEFIYFLNTKKAQSITSEDLFD